jgi:hypothetical protein
LVECVSLIRTTSTRIMKRWPMNPGIIHCDAGLSSLPVNFVHSLPNSSGRNQINPITIWIIHAAHTAKRLMFVNWKFIICLALRALGIQIIWPLL